MSHSLDSSGLDWTLESRARVRQAADLRAPWPQYGPVRWVVAVKEGSRIRFRCHTGHA